MQTSTLSALSAMTSAQRAAFDAGELVIVYEAGMPLDEARRWAWVVDAEAIRSNRTAAQAAKGQEQ